MAVNQVKQFQAKQFEKATAGERVSGFMTRHRKPIIIALIAAVVALAAYVAAVFVMSRTTQRGVSAVYEIEYNLTRESTGLSDDELEARRSEAETALAQYLSKGGIVGARANMLAAEIAHQRGDYSGAKSYWEAVAAKSRSSYLAPLAFFNIGVCSEAAGDLTGAADYYARAADNADFMLSAHARFSEGRIYEAQGDWAKAAEAYNKLNADSSGGTWTNLATTRLIALRAEGKIE